MISKADCPNIPHKNYINGNINNGSAQTTTIKAHNRQSSEQMPVFTIISTGFGMFLKTWLEHSDGTRDGKRFYCLASTYHENFFGSSGPGLGDPESKSPLRQMLPITTL